MPNTSIGMNNNKGFGKMTWRRFKLATFGDSIEFVVFIQKKIYNMEKNFKYNVTNLLENNKTQTINRLTDLIKAPISDTQ